MEDCTHEGHAGDGPVRKTKLRVKADFRSSTVMYALRSRMPPQHKPSPFWGTVLAIQHTTWREGSSNQPNHLTSGRVDLETNERATWRTCGA